MTTSLATLVAKFSGQLDSAEGNAKEVLIRAVHAAYGLASTEQSQAANPSKGRWWEVGDVPHAVWDCVIPNRHYLGVRVWQTKGGRDIAAEGTILALGLDEITETANRARDDWHSADGILIGFNISAASALSLSFNAKSGSIKTRVRIWLAGANQKAFGPVVSLAMSAGELKTVDCYFDKAS